ncbi:MAG: diguanylate cyclase [Gaiellales bacterium]
MIWLISAVAVLVAVAAANYMAGSYRDSGDHRARTIGDAQLALARLQGSIRQEANDRLTYELTGAQAYRSQFGADSAATDRQLRTLTAAARQAGLPAPALRLIGRFARDLNGWEATVIPEMAPSRPGSGPRPGRAGSGSRNVDPTVQGLLRDLAQLQAVLTLETRSALQAADDHAMLADVVRQIATLIGLIILCAGGVTLLREAFVLAGQADARREREERWNSQIEAILAWSSRAKGAATRSQLIGFAHMAPKDAIGASCLMVTEGVPPAHRSHGLPRLTVEADDSGDGLHVSVCFAPDRGDELDHHALDLMLGHLSALWRTVLRQEDLQRAAGHDALTGLPNRRNFEAELRRRVALSKRSGLGFALAIVDLDHFKSVNDSFGHPEGDAVLRRAGEAIRATLRASDRVFRLGGEEFALILETADAEGLEDLLERAREAVKALAVDPAPGARMSASIGWASFPDDAEDRAELVAAADAALYRAKNGGRDRVLRADGAALL